MPSNVDLVVINPNSRRKVYQGLDPFAAIEPPLWCRIIAGYIRDHGYSVKIIDAEAMNLAAKDVASIVEGMKPELICVVAFGHQPSASTQHMAGLREVCDVIKNYKNIKSTIIGVGGHISALPERTLMEEQLDWVCKGEGPKTVLGLLEGKAPKEIPGLGWMGLKDDVILTPSATLITDLDEIAGDVWDLLPMTKYRAHNWQCFGGWSRQPYASIYTSLGCPYKCGFCCINAPFDSNRYRMRSADSVVEEISNLYDRYKVRVFKIIDEMFVLNDKHVNDICDGLLAQEFENQLNIWAYARVDTIKSTDQLKKMRAAGIQWLALGIESGSKLVRDGAEKNLKNDDIIGVVRQIQEAGINVIGNFIFGLPDDTYQSMEDTMNLAVTLNCEFANFYSAMAYPGSKLYEETVKKNGRLPFHWSGYSQHSYDCTPMETAVLHSEEVLRFRDAAFELYFSTDRYLNMVQKKFGDDAVRQIKEMTKVDLSRQILGQ